MPEPHPRAVLMIDLSRRAPEPIKRALWAALSALAVTACAAPTPAVTPTPAPAPAPPAAAPVAPHDRHALRPLPVDPAFEAAVQRGTRTTRGLPGADYWTQQVDYTIDAELNPRTGRLEGEERIVYHNNSPHTLDQLVLRLYQNLFAPGVPRNRTVPITGGMELGRVVVDGVEAVADADEGDAGYEVAGTILRIEPPRPIAPGASATLEIAWSFTVPPAGAPRHGHIDHRVYNVAQWYPQVATYDDLNGWHTWPYLGDGEFYLEYGDFDVSLTVPEGWVVGATGVLRNPDDVLPPTVRQRLERARAQDEVVHVVTEEMFGPGSATQQTPGGSLTWRFRARQVRDFAFATSDRYLWDATRVITPDNALDDDEARDTVAVHAFYTPEATTWRDAAEYIRHAVGFHADNWHPYVWPHMTGASGPVGGMEYPMLTFVGAFSSERTVYEVLNHEIGHMWYPMMVGSNEPSYPWMDEGLTTYIENYATGDYFDDDDAWLQTQASVARALALAGHTPIMRHADLHGPTGTRGASSYTKPATLLLALESIIGRDAVWRALAEYADAWLFRHPHPIDFFNTVERVADRDLDWFWYPWFHDTVAMDQAIRSVSLAQGGHVATVTIEDEGGAPMPILLSFTLGDGTIEQRTVPVDVWIDTRTRTWSGTFELRAPVTRVEVAAALTGLEPDRSDNVWTP